MNAQTKAIEIYEAMKPFRKNPYQLEYDSSYIIQQLTYFVEHQMPIKMVIPACHGKSRPGVCVFDKLPDYGEYLGVLNFVRLCNVIRNCYEHGAQLDIIHEGYFYVLTPFVENDEEFSLYMDKITSLLNQYPFIRSVSLPDFFPELANNDIRRVTFMDQYAPSMTEINELIHSEERIQKLYISYKKIYEKYYQDILAANDMSTKKFNKICKEKAKLQLQIYLGFGRLVKDFYQKKQYIRLSTLYKTPDFYEQFSVNYLPDEHHIGTPSFNCVYRDKDGKHQLIKYQDAIQRGMSIQHTEGFKYFVEY